MYKLEIFFYNSRKSKKFRILVITFQPFEIEKRTISQKKHLNVTNLEYFMQFVTKMNASTLKLAIYQPKFLSQSLHFSLFLTNRLFGISPKKIREIWFFWAFWHHILPISPPSMLVCQGEFFIIFDLGHFGPQGAVLYVCM